MTVKPAKYRSQLRIFYDMLNVIVGEGGRARPTRILYGANLSYDRLQRYLNELKKRGLIEEFKEGDITFYVITEKGCEFVREFKRIEAFAKAFGLSI